MAKKRNVLVECPECHEKRYVSHEYHRAQMLKGRDWMCSDCAKRTKRVRQSQLSAMKRVEANKIDSLKVPCGVIRRTRLSERCEPYDDCEHYWECLCRVAELDWRGWHANA